MAALTSAGLTVKTAAEVRTDLESAVKAPGGFGPSASTRVGGPLGKLIGVISTAIGLVWSLLRQLYDAFDPDQAEGEQLDNISAFVGVTRLAATKTTGTITLDGTPSTVIPLGRIVRIGSAGEQFLTTVEVTIGGGGTVEVVVEAENTGPIQATAGSIDTIVTAVSGWDSITHDVDLVTGRDVELDADLRARREGSLQITGGSTDGSIQAQLAELEGVLAARVRSNRTMGTVDTIPPKSFESVVWPDTLAEEPILELIYQNMPAGMEAYGSSVTGTVTTSEGYSAPVAFTWAAELDTYITVTVTTDPTLYPVNGDTLIETAVKAYADALTVGDDLVLVQVLCAALEAAPGILTAVVTALVGSAPGGGDTSNIAATFRQIVTAQLANISAVST